MPETPDAPKHLPGADLTLATRDRPEGGPGRAELLAAVAAALWLALALAFLVLAPGALPGGVLTGVTTAIGILVPLLLIWVIASAARTRRALMAEARSLRVAIEAMKAAQSRTVVRPPAAVPPRTGSAPDEAPLFTTRRDPSGSEPGASPAGPSRRAESGPIPDQAALALGQGDDHRQGVAAHADLVRALDFPDSPDDTEAVHALRRTLEDRAAAKLIRAAQDVLMLLAKDGIFMDDLRPERARVEIWRRFAQGERGRTVAALGGVRDRSSLALSMARMRGDTIFRDACHHFLRQFDRALAEFEKTASDQELADLAETRTARAFMLLGRVMGVFD
ncbi:MAG: hypothetical protein ACKVPY_04700 [Paracoccaceae bacterium]